MKGYKAFERDLVCRGKVYKENTTFEENAENCGMHFCKNPLDTLTYYPLIDREGNITEFAEVEALDSAETDDNEVFCTKKLKIGSKLSLSQFIEASLDFASQNIKSQVEMSDSARFSVDNNAEFVRGAYVELAGGDCTKLIGNKYAKLADGMVATLIGGNGVAIVGGDLTRIVGKCYAKLIGGDSAKVIGDEGATIIGGAYAELVGGDCAKLVGDNYARLVGSDGAILVGGGSAKLTGGDYSKVVGSNYTTLAGGKNAIIVGDNGSAAKGKKGAIILLIERDNEMNIINFKAVQVDGEKIKEDTLYELENGEFVEVAR